MSAAVSITRQDHDAAGLRRLAASILRREGLYSSALSGWRRQRDAGAHAALKAVKRGPKRAPAHPLAAGHTQLLRDNKRLTLQLHRAEAVIDIQNRVAALLGIPIPTDGVP